MKNKKKVIFVQGYGDYSDGKWPVWLGQEVTKEGFDFVSLKLPDPMFPVAADWLQALREAKLVVNEDTYFVGHSLGCITIVRYLEILSGHSKAGGCIFVSGFCDFPKIPLIYDFCIPPVNWEKAKAKAGDIFVVLSDDDRLVPLASGQEFAKRLNAGVIIEKGQGHFKEDVEKIPSVLNCILEMDQMREEKKEIKKLRKFKK